MFRHVYWQIGNGFDGNSSCSRPRSSSPYVEPERQNSFRRWIGFCVCFSLQDRFTFSTAWPRKTLFNYPGLETCCNVRLGSKQSPHWRGHVNPDLTERKTDVNDQVQPRPHLLGVTSHQEVRPRALFLSRVRWKQAKLKWLSGSPPADWPRMERHPPAEWKGGYLKNIAVFKSKSWQTASCKPVQFYATTGSLKKMSLSNTCTLNSTRDLLP